MRQPSPAIRQAVGFRTRSHPSKETTLNTNVLIVSKGHDYAHDSFLAMFAAMPSVTATLVEQPAAQVVLKPEHVGAYDSVLFYDMSGIPGVGLLH